MNTPVVFDRHGDTYTVTFSYDPDIAAVIKTLPGYARSWSPHTKHWIVDDDHAGLAAALRELGCTVLGLEAHARTRLRRVGTPVVCGCRSCPHPGCASCSDEDPAPRHRHRRRGVAARTQRRPNSIGDLKQ